ncbi:MAG: small nuclear ribonucleoprotein [Candidatus Methanofastidiosa archaeon]|nr:small nuclear ribonucleoprotein [Candidatus Methanofastidiosa archaeon]
MIEKPFDLIHKNLNRQTFIYLKDGRLLAGKMIGYDKELNISLSDAFYEGREDRVYDRVVIRRNNIISIGNEEEIIWTE